jgi:hypothetical protein
MPKNFQKKQSNSIVRKSIALKKTLSNRSKENLKFSFQYLDTTQKFGSSFKDWQKVGLLSKMLELIQGYCCRPVLEQVDGQKFTIYGDFPSSEKTLFKFPKMVPEDANWGRIHVTGPAVIVGHVVEDTFYVVFLDKTHKFYLTKKTIEN